MVVSKEKSHTWRWLKIFESRPHEAVSFAVRREKETKERDEQKLPKVLPGYSGERLSGRCIKEKGREEGEVDEDRGQRRIWNDFGQEVVAGIKEKASALDSAKEAAQRSAGQSVMRSWDCSHIENEEEDVSWRERDQMAAQWDAEQKLEEIFVTKKDGRKLLAVGGHATRYLS